LKNKDPRLKSSINLDKYIETCTKKSDFRPWAFIDDRIGNNFRLFSTALRFGFVESCRIVRYRPVIDENQLVYSANVSECSANSTSWKSREEQPAEIDLRTVAARFGRRGGNSHQFFSERDNREDKECTRGRSHVEKLIAGGCGRKIIRSLAFLFRDALRNAKPRTFRKVVKENLPASHFAFSARIFRASARVNKTSNGYGFFAIPY